MTVTRLLMTLCAPAAAGLALATALPMDFIHHGNFRRMVHTGDTQGVVALAALPAETGRWGLGATAGLKGEIVQVDGRLLVSPGSDAQGRALKRVPRMGEDCLWFEQETRLPQNWTQADDGALQGLACAGYGSGVTITASMGMQAADYALNRILNQ